MKNSWIRKFGAGALGLVLATGTALATGSTNPHPLEGILPGTKLQGVEKFDHHGVKVHLNETLDGVNIEGWSTKPLTQAETEAILRQFGVRTTTSTVGPDGSFIIPDNVGRAGVLEGETYLKLDGKVYKGLTLKGYGGNSNGANFRGPQPDGSLDLTEALYDTEVSKLMVENGVDSYLGVIVVERPGNRANFVRLSRTVLRMEDLQRIKGPSVMKIVDYLTDLMRDEMGKKLTPVEFTEWLATHTGDLMARKEHLRMYHGSITNSNLGIGELVDFGGAELMLPGDEAGSQYKTFKQSERFKTILNEVHKNLSAADADIAKVNSAKLFDEAFSGRLKDLQKFDSERINLSKANEVDLTKIGFTAQEAADIVKYNANTIDGIIDPSEVKEIQGISREIDEILAKTTTEFLRLSDGTRLSSYYVRSAGGPEGVRDLLGKARDLVTQKNLKLTRGPNGEIDFRSADVKTLQVELEKLAVEKARSLGFTRVLVGKDATQFARFIARQLIEVIVKR